MGFVWFIYGLAFFVLGFSIFLYPKRNSQFKLANHLYLIAWFGILHGINEWLDLFIYIGEPIDPDILEIIRMITLPMSFLFFFQFGARSIPLQSKKLNFIRFLTPVAFILWLIVYLFSVGDKEMWNPRMWDIWSRYLLCLPGGFIVAWGLWRQIPEFKTARVPGVIRDLKLAAVTFAIYAVLAGFVVKDADFFPANVINYTLFKAKLGFPVQILRALCAVVMAFSIVQVLSIFNWEARRKLHETQLRFRTIAEEAPVIFFMAYVDMVITFADGKGLEHIGLKRDEIVGKSVDEVFPHVPQVKDDCTRTLAGEEVVSSVSIGDLVFQACYSPFKRHSGQIDGLTAVFVDITQRVRAEAELDSFRQEMQRNQNLASLGTMSDKMAHDIGEPLAVIRVFLQRIMREFSRDGDSAAAAKKIKNCLEEVAKVTSTIDRFYESAQITPRPKPEPIDLYSLVQRIVAVFAESARNARLQISTVGMDVAPSMRISEKQLEQIFFILVQNAIDTADGKELRALNIGYTKDRDYIYLEFADTCGGIPEEKMPYIFEPFIDIGPANKGSGMALAIIKRIVNACDGKIQASSEYGKGTTFVVSLPVEQIY